ncbi:MAG: HAMP domain-containing sensor histidine kinase, partial [Cyclobacteriaceae bacterium]
PYIINAVPLPDANDVVSEILVVIINNSDVKRMEEDLRRNLEKEKELNELKSRFVTMASHEFRTPLSTILSSVFLLEKYEGREFDEKKYKHIERIKKTIYNLTEILNDFLSLGKFEEGKIHVSSEPVDIENLIADVIKEMTEVRKAEQTISYTHQGNPIIYSDKILLRNIIVNLLFNSIKYSAAGSKIEIISNTADGVFSMHVSDNGIGIPEESQPHIFNRFYRAGNANNVQGTGLGLHLVKKYTELLNGEVSFKSKAGVGTTFTINLKLEEQSNKNINEIHTADRRQ